MALAVAAPVIAGANATASTGASPARFCTDLRNIRAHSDQFFAGLGPAPSTLHAGMSTRKLAIAFHRIDVAWMRLARVAPSALKPDVKWVEKLSALIAYDLAHTKTVAQFYAYEQAHPPSVRTVRATKAAERVLERYLRTTCHTARSST